MKVVIQCAGKKVEGAGFWKTRAGQQVKFVAAPSRAPDCAGFLYAHPDHDAGDGETWREKLRAYNRSDENPQQFLQAYQLYKAPVYRELVNRYDVRNVYILSAGWGLVPANFLLPRYDITFSRGAKIKPYARQATHKNCDGFYSLLKNSEARVVFFGSKNYLPLFERLTKNYKGERVAYYKSQKQKPVAGVRLIHFKSKKNQNWHYDCARKFMAGEITL